MTIRPIIFSTPMVQALLAGRKTQTRRLASSPLRRVEVGDLLYVRESCVIAPRGWTTSPANPRGPFNQEVGYVADGVSEAARDYGLKTSPSIHMPRWASRLTLEVTRVRYDRLQRISSADSIAEGIEPSANSQTIDCDTPDPRETFHALWDWLHEKPGERWADDPQIVALTFKVQHANVDQVAAGKAVA